MHQAARAQAPMRLWVGPEPTVNRVGDRYFDQLEANGFAHRLDDIDRLCELGPERVRFPLLWERTAPDDPAACSWGWSEVRLQRLRTLAVKPILGLLHHGSGPRYTSLEDPQFPEKLATYARQVTQRYPWVDAYTPVNEPLTTARFSGLYGLWYPHGRSVRSFVRTLINQLRGIVLAMREVRAVNPDAQLVQTEDLGFTASTWRLRYQACFENERRWLTFDLLAGRVDERHPMWGYLRSGGAKPDELDWFVENPCPPDVIGINAYVSSERFLDHRLDRYPALVHGGNGQDRYADVERVRVRGQIIGGFAARLRETHARYGLPIAVTEAHLGCTRDEQLRWLLDAWRAAEDARSGGIDVRAVTAWAAFGSFDWDSLLTRWDGHYEPGLWDVRGPQPRATALAGLVQRLAAGARTPEPVLQGEGWWRRDSRIVYPQPPNRRARRARGAPVLITGATGTLGRAFARVCEVRGIPYLLLRRADLDIADAASVQQAIARHAPWAIVNAAGYVRVDDAEGDARHWRENVQGPIALAEACAQARVRLLTFSSDLVFDGEKPQAYLESDRPNPLNAYGSGKHVCEVEVLARHPQALVVRTAAFFGPWDPYNFVTRTLQALRRGERWRAAADQWVSPTYVPHLVQASLDLLIDGEGGLWHLANQGEASWFELARSAALGAQLDVSLIEPVPGKALPLKAARPRRVPLSSERGCLLPPLESALAAYLGEVSRDLRA
jgi:dTDP-4-dehydrorhamnose reductase